MHVSGPESRDRLLEACVFLLMRSARPAAATSWAVQSSCNLGCTRSLLFCCTGHLPRPAWPAGRHCSSTKGEVVLPSSMQAVALRARTAFWRLQLFAHALLHPDTLHGSRLPAFHCTSRVPHS